MFKDKINSILIVILILGISLLAYPSLADFWNASRSTKIISEYSENLNKLNDEDIKKELEKAREYNKKLAEKPHSTDMTKEELDEYNSLLKIGATDVMATVEIPSINVRLPVYHGSEDSVLQSALGHIEWTSLPVGERELMLL
ncbi:MAG: hypothetical protein ACTIH2_04910 [Anaerococcus sp.]